MERQGNHHFIVVDTAPSALGVSIPPAYLPASSSFIAETGEAVRGWERGHSARATSLVWLTVSTATLKDRRNAYGDQVLVRLAEVLPAGVRVRIVADRGFGDQKLYRMLAEELKFAFVIRCRGNITVTAAHGEARPAAEWVGAGGRARVLRGATATAAGHPVATVVCVQAKDMKQP